MENIAAAYRTKVEFEILGDIPALVCDAAFNARLAESVQQAAPALAVHGGVHTTGSEDFAFFAPHVPTAMFFIGAETDDGTPTYNQHNPSVRFNDKALRSQPPSTPSARSAGSVSRCDDFCRPFRRAAFFVGYTKVRLVIEQSIKIMV